MYCARRPVRASMTLSTSSVELTLFYVPRVVTIYHLSCIASIESNDSMIANQCLWFVFLFFFSVFVFCFLLDIDQFRHEKDCLIQYEKTHKNSGKENTS